LDPKKFRRRAVMADDSSGASGAVWALVTLLIVLIVVGALYFGGAFSQKKSIDINVQKPNLILKV
jgi:Flp pilus assembly protein TadG